MAHWKPLPQSVHLALRDRRGRGRHAAAGIGADGAARAGARDGRGLRARLGRRTRRQEDPEEHDGDQPSGCGAASSRAARWHHGAQDTRRPPIGHMGRSAGSRRGSRGARRARRRGRRCPVGAGSSPSSAPIRATGGRVSPVEASSAAFAAWKTVGGRSVEGDLAEPHHDDPREGRRRELHVVGDRDDRPAGPSVGADDGLDPVDAVGVLPGRRLVEDEHRPGPSPGRRRAPRACAATGRGRTGWSCGRPAARPPRGCARPGPGCPPRPVRGSAVRTRPRARPSARTAGRRGSGRRTRRSTRARTTVRSAVSAPSIETRPSAGRSRPSRCLTSVVLPDPFWPTIATASPGSIASDTPRTASTPFG